jgi:hypothetical protein
MCRMNADLGFDERASNHIVAAFRCARVLSRNASLTFGSDGSIRWFESNREASRQSAVTAGSASSAPKTKPSDSESGKNKGKGSKSKSSKDEGLDKQNSSDIAAAQYEGLWIVPGGTAAAAIDTISWNGSCILAAASECGRVFLWLLPRKSSGGVCFGRSSIQPHYVMQVVHAIARCCYASTVLGAFIDGIEMPLLTLCDCLRPQGFSSTALRAMSWTVRETIIMFLSRHSGRS